MVNLVQFLDLIKQYTDKKHPLSQSKLRGIATQKGINIGDKKTFRRNLTTLAKTYNMDADPNHWKIVYPGYTPDTDISEKVPQRSGSIYYNHEISTDELDFIIQQISDSDIYTDEEKESFKKRLTNSLASSYYQPPTTQAVTPFANSNLSISNLTFIKHAISEEKMIEFRLLALRPDKNDNLRFKSLAKTYWVSPYRIVYAQGFYWLLGNERLTHKGDKKPINSAGYQYIKYSPSIDAFRIDRITDLKYAKENYEKKSKTDFYYGSSNPSLSDRLDLLSHNIAIYIKDTAVVTSINGNDLSETYGKIDFEILWEHFQEEQRNDYSFIRDNFGDNFSFTKKEAHPIITVQASEEYFIDFALRYIDRIRILDTDAGNKIKKQIAKKVNFL